MTPPVSTTDVVVIGAGHNSLIMAAYLVRAGLSVTVLESRHVIGGGTVTEELTAPGFLSDSAATGHMALQYNPVILDDELGLSKYGLEYIAPEPVTVVFDGDDPSKSATLWLDSERTAKQFDSHHGGDGEAFLQLLADWDSISTLHIARMAGEPGSVPNTSAEEAARWAELAGGSAWEAVTTRFVSEEARRLFLWIAAMTTQPLEAPGTGMISVMLPGIMGRVSWPNAIGGAASLGSSLRRLIEEDGRSQVITNAEVKRIEITKDRATGVVTVSGERYAATEGVVSSSHAVHLKDLLGQEPLPSEFESLAAWRAGSSMIVQHLALDMVPEYRSEVSPHSVLAGSMTYQGMLEQAEAVREGRLAGPGLWILAACSTVVDPTRSPDGKAVLKIMTSAPYELADGRSWAAVKEEYADFVLGEYAKITTNIVPGEEIARVVHSPVDLESWDSAFYRGGLQGGEMTPDQMGPNRPVAGWSGYRMPYERLYQTGSSTHPGGTVAGFAGRNTARVVLEDVGHPDIESVIKPWSVDPTQVRLPGNVPGFGPSKPEAGL